ncbi:MAG: Ig-like domain-containing protein [Flavisolibacter sp.]
MKRPTVLRLWPVLCLLLILSACQKETKSPDMQQKPGIPNAVSLASGVVPDDPAKVAKVPTIVSAGFLKSTASQLSSAQLFSARGKPSKSDVTPPTVSITSPANGAVVSGSVTIQVSASDNVGVSSVSLTVDGYPLGTLTAAPYAFAWTADGNSHTITATAVDAAGNTASNSISITQNTVKADTTLPTVSITSPASGSALSGTVTVAVTATDNVGVSSVSLSLDGAPLATLSSAPYSYSWNTSSVPDGNHTLTATAADAAGNKNSYSILVTQNATVTTLPPTTLPSSYDMQMPPVQNQGGESSCVPFAAAYAARSADFFYKTGASSYDLSTNVFSPEFVYDQTKISDCGSGTSVTTVLNFLSSTGVCTWQSMPYSYSNGCSLLPTAAQTAEAANFKIGSFSKLVSSDVTGIKTMVLNKHAVIITVATDNSFWGAQPGFIWKAYSESPGISHSLVICGYDDAKHAYKVMNSWGTSWGEQGYSWIDYDFLYTCSFYYVYVLNA